MAHVKFDPFRGFDSLTKRMNDIVNDINKGVTFEYGGFDPKIDVFEEDGKIFMTAELAGVKKEDVKVSINDENIMTIKGTKSRDAEPAEGKERTYLKAERIYGDFARTFVLPENVDRDSVEAKYENGVLRLTIGTKEPEKPKEKQITIS